MTINKALVQDKTGKWVVKTTKTVDSTRTVVLPQELADLIREKGVIYDGYPGAIRNHLAKVLEKLGIQAFPLHKLRHFYASYLHQLGYSDKAIQDMGGWKSGNILKTVYTHSMEIEKAKLSAASDFGALM